LASGITKTAAGSLAAEVLSSPALSILRQRLEAGGVVCLEHAASAAHPFLAAVLRRAFPRRPIVVVMEDLRTQETCHQDLQTWLSEPDAAADAAAGALLFFPAWEMLPHEAKLPHADVIGDRLETLVGLSQAGGQGGAGLMTSATSASGFAPLVVTNVTALLQKTFSPEALVARTRRLRQGDRLDPLDLIEWLEEQGYEPEAQVNHRGEIALRGGIVDVFPLTSPWPVRLEFFGDELESLRFFDPVSQISREGVDEIVIPPGGELGILKRLASPGEGATATPTPPLVSLLGYLPPETIVVLCESARLEERAAEYAELVPEGDLFHVGWDELQRGMTAAGMTLVTFSEAGLDDLATPLLMDGAGDGSEGGALTLALGEHLRPEELRMESLDAYRPIGERAPDPQVAEAQRRDFFGQLHRWIRQGRTVNVFCNNEGERQRFTEIWAEYGFGETNQAEVGTAGEAKAEKGAGRRRKNSGGEAKRNATPATHATRRAATDLRIHLGTLSRGFLFEAADLVVVTDAEIFGRYKVQRPRRLKSAHAQTSRSLLEINFSDLQEGDYVVHLEHGIGRYVGLQMMPAAAGARPLGRAMESPRTDQECLVIEYAAREPDQPPPRLFVPVSEAHLVGKYVGAGKARPVLNTLGGGRWQKAKEQAERAVRDLAAELLTIQAARASQPGHASQADTSWQREFESSFLYEETPDQEKAIVDTKRDMESTRPMDRLICGDVGYGKTEVAIRAAFKAVMDGRQVAVLVPTTVLAQQHFNTFRERMADYPVRVELLSRFRTPRQQRKVIADLAAGSVDIVIGTHRLVQSDIAFKELGLVVIDEEQRFGVLHKEKFKMLRQLVDVLTLSATPIPRTLHLALTGARDMSVIETPPQDRLPVETVVCEYDERVIRDAILREIGRGGQIFYLHNRVLDIETVGARLRALLPRARILVGHGQMNSDDLEEVMTRFVNGEADVLLSTTIIESGIDIPNANTIIIDRADRFGLSDLYQLRGRVGRYKHQAYAYLLIPRHARMLTDARKRISAIKQYSSLGSGFKIAMRDLELRGAGNMLGAQQSGHITAVGFELYCQLLKQSVAALKGEKVRPRVDVLMRLDFIVLSPGEDDAPTRPARRGGKSEARPGVAVPRETATYLSDRSADAAGTALAGGGERVAIDYGKAHAFVPPGYVPEGQQRIEIYRRFAEITDAAGADALQAELRDRFGRLPGPVELLLQVAQLRVLAAERGIVGIESRGDKLMLTRAGDFIQVGGRFPRLTKKEPRARLNEVKRLIEMVPP
jgi:transcription-repair coupling factor (superfamily II helicase)